VVLTYLRSRQAVRRAPEQVALARSLDDAIAEAWQRAYPAWSATTALCDAHARGTVRAATPELSSLAETLREADDVDAEALRLCRRLLTDGFSSPLYKGDADDLRREARRLRFRLLAIDSRG
jgi:hypothetical protein